MGHPLDNASGTYAIHTHDRIHQGDVIKDLTFLIERPNPDNPAEPSAEYYNAEFAVVLTQECDLEQDFAVRYYASAKTGTDKLLRNVLLAIAKKPMARALDALACRLGDIILANAVLASHARNQVDPKDKTQKIFNREKWQNVANNKEERYHLIESCPPHHAGLLIDFKNVFSMNADYLYDLFQRHPEKFPVSLTVPYREHLSGRFGYYVSRIALPRDHNDPTKSPMPQTIPGQAPQKALNDQGSAPPAGMK